VHVRHQLEPSPDIRFKHACRCWSVSTTTSTSGKLVAWANWQATCSWGVFCRNRKVGMPAARYRANFCPGQRQVSRPDCSLRCQWPEAGPHVGSKRVPCCGTGSSGVQRIPEMAKGCRAPSSLPSEHRNYSFPRLSQSPSFLSSGPEHGWPASPPARVAQPALSSGRRPLSFPPNRTVCSRFRSLTTRTRTYRASPVGCRGHRQCFPPSPTRCFDIDANRFLGRVRCRKIRRYGLADLSGATPDTPHQPWGEASPCVRYQLTTRRSTNHMVELVDLRTNHSSSSRRPGCSQRKGTTSWTCVGDGRTGFRCYQPAPAEPARALVRTDGLTLLRNGVGSTGPHELSRASPCPVYPESSPSPVP